MKANNSTHFLIKTPQALKKEINLSKSQELALTQTHALFPIRLPQALAKSNTQDDTLSPVLQQFIPQAAELIETPGYSKDPLKEKDAQQLPGLLQKYSGRVLVTLTQACAVHCRYCFRRHFPYHDNTPGKAGIEKIVATLQADTTIHEIILSGGDPLMVNNNYLSWCLNQFKTIKHIKTIRFHTRVPTVLPQRIDSDFLQLIQDSELNVIMVLHVNHAQEITPSASKALHALHNTHITLMNQSVLLRNINDTADNLMALSHALWQHKVLPYYLHCLDKVQGTAHFDVSKQQAKELIQTLRNHLPGYLVPRLAYEQAFAESKILLA